MTIEALATRSGVTSSTISRLENGRQGAYASTVIKLARALEVSPPVLQSVGSTLETTVRQRDEAASMAVPPSSTPARPTTPSQHADFYREQLARLRAMTQRELAEDLAAMDVDPERQAEITRIDTEFDGLSWEAILDAQAGTGQQRRRIE